MTELVVHIGFNKCGSTAIQNMLAVNQAALSRLGFAFRRTDPRPGVICSNPQFLELAYSEAGQCVRPRRAAAVLGYTSGNLSEQQAATAAFSKDYSDWARQRTESAAIISNEFLAPWLDSPALINALDNWLKQLFTKVRYVAYIRLPQFWFISQFGQTIKNKTNTLTLDEFIDRRGVIGFGKHLKNWLNTVGPDRLDVRLFDEAWRRDSGLLVDFCAAIGVDPTSLVLPNDRLNQSFAQAWDWRIWHHLRRSLTDSRPRRPELTRAQHDRVRLLNEDDFQWIARTFFQTNPQRFDIWFSSDTAHHKRKLVGWGSPHRTDPTPETR